MIDLHSHILYNIDDGATTFEESLAMCRVAATDGTRVIAATPHGPGSTACYHYQPQLIHERAAELNAALAAENVSIEVVAGTEIYYDADILQRLERGTLLPYASSNAILVEVPYEGIPSSFEIVLFNLQVAGYRVILAHPERYFDVQRDPNRLLPLVERGALMQLTAEALTGRQGARLRATAETLLAHGLAHLLASDAHGMRPRRPPLLAEGLACAVTLVGPTAAEALVTTTPAAVLNNLPLQLPPPQPVARQPRRWWR